MQILNQIDCFAKIEPMAHATENMYIAVYSTTSEPE